MGNVISESSSKFNLTSRRRKKVKSYRSIASSTTTATSRSSESSPYHFIDGRTFNENTNYSLPNDDEEIDRLHRQHYLVRYVWQGNFCAPVHRILKRPGVKVLDVGCGPGTWLFEMALDYPEAHFTGIDISPMYPKEIKPINVDFEEVDISKGLPFGDETFDFIVMRNMVAAVSEEDWRSTLKECERVCKPGGFVEVLEFEVPGYHIGPTTKRIIEAVIQIMRTKSIDITLAPQIEDIFLRSTKLVNLEHHVRTIPFGKWGGKVGKLMAEDLFLITQALAPIVIPLWGIGANQYQEFADGLVRELEVEKKAYCKIHTIFAQKYEPYLYI